MKATLYSDGGSRGNPGPAAIGYVLRVVGGEVVEHGEHIGHATNNQAEYAALLKGIERARTLSVVDLECFLDSELVVKQLTGEYRVRDADLKPLWIQVNEARAAFDKVTFRHVPRERNKQADALVNLALDKSQLGL
jgi:ribonuclease HI